MVVTLGGALPIIRVSRSGGPDHGKGTYYVGVIADDLGQVSEAEAPSTTTITGSAPDLVVTEVTAPATGVAGGKIAMSITVLNQGGAAAGPFRVGFRFSADSIITSADALSSSVCTYGSGLGAGSSSVCSGDVTVPSTLEPWAYYVGTIADKDDEVAESDESNNARAAPTATLISPALPDLVVDSLTAAATGTTPGSIEISVTVRNVGAGTETAFATGLYFSTDAEITTSDVYSGMECGHPAGLGPNKTATCAGPITVPGTLAPGTYHVGAIADHQEVVTEGDETNNARAAESPTTLTLAPLNLTIAGMYLTQATQDFFGSVPLVAGRDAFLRVFVVGNRAEAVTPSVRVRFYQDGTLVDTRTISPGRTVVTTVDEGTLASSWNLPVSGALVQPGLSVLADVDPGQEIPEGDESDNAFPVSGAPASVNVGVVPTFEVNLVPILTTSNNQTGLVNTGNKDSFFTDAMKMLPLFDYDATVGPVFTTNASALTESLAWVQIISELDALRIAEGSSRYYYGVLRAIPNAYVCGFGFIPGFTALGMDQCGAPTAAHEWGHNFGLRHAPCGDAPDPDPNYPYPDARLGTYGFDVATQTLKAPDLNYDLMAYCQARWISDYHYRMVMAVRTLLDGAPGADEPVPTLLVWGRIEDGEVVLEPAFEVRTRSAMPRTPGPYRLEGRAADGGSLFSFSFAGEPTSGGASGDRHFTFAVPIDWVPELVTLRVEGPGLREAVRSVAAPVGAPSLRAAPAAAASSQATDRVAVSWDPESFPMVMVRDPDTGRIVSFARGGDAVVGTGARALELVFSDGVRSVVRTVSVEP